jgi:hypothetical protein
MRYVNSIALYVVKQIELTAGYFLCKFFDEFTKEAK